MSPPTSSGSNLLHENRPAHLLHFLASTPQHWLLVDPPASRSMHLFWRRLGHGIRTCNRGRVIICRYRTTGLEFPTSMHIRMLSRDLYRISYRACPISSSIQSHASLLLAQTRLVYPDRLVDVLEGSSCVPKATLRSSTRPLRSIYEGSQSTILEPCGASRDDSS